jgi:glycosyltransferase involved in cell wall biosynthesis
MKRELCDEYGVAADKITVIPYGINNAVSRSTMTVAEAKQRLGLQAGEKAILFFGAIARYKGLDLLVSAFEALRAEDQSYRLIIAGVPRGEGSDVYFKKVQDAIRPNPVSASILQRIEYIPDDDIEVFFKAADLIALPYREIFQSGIFFLAYSYGLPVVAADVGSFREDVIEGETGFLYSPADPDGLANAVQRYFASAIYHHLDQKRAAIEKYALARHSWSVVYEELLSPGLSIGA